MGEVGGYNSKLAAWVASREFGSIDDSVLADLVAKCRRNKLSGIPCILIEFGLDNLIAGFQQA